MKICKKPYQTTLQFSRIFNEWSFSLSNFQKYAIEGIVKNKNILVTAHTGSGKTIPADFTIKFMNEKGKKVIYTSPIKALSNQKLREFQNRFSNISFGIITGDIRFNPDADVLIMTTEVLRNYLVQQQMIKEKTIEKEKINLLFDIDIERDLGAVIFDEIHYINDQHRGQVWEQTIMMLPNHIQMVMLSATISKPELFANWIEEQKDKEVWLCPTTRRVVPLAHHSFFTIPETHYKKFPQKMQIDIRELHNNPLLFKEQNGKFLEENYHKVSKIIKYISKNRIRINKDFVFNEMIKYLYKKERLPAIAFVFSRKQAQKFAEKVELSLYPPNSKIPSIIEKECQQILMKLPNYKEYIELPEYKTIIKLLKKGIAVHHAGIPQIFRELIEQLFDKNYVKLLCATETFAVGINMPTKSVIFPSISKFDGMGFRPLMSHEYSQMAGRAGRRGIDKFGDIYHLSNLILSKNDAPDANAYRLILDGNPQQFVSKFKINFNLVLQLISSNNNNFEEFIKKSMISSSINKEREFVENKLIEERKKIVKEPNYITEEYILNNYIVLESNLKTLKPKKRKPIYRELQKVEDFNKYIKKDIEKFKLREAIKLKIQNYESEIKNIDSYIINEVNIILNILEEHKFIEKEDKKLILLEKGKFAVQIQEIHSLAVAELASNKTFDDLSVVEFGMVLSAFVKISIPDNQRVISIESINCNKKVKNTLFKIKETYNKYQDIELFNKLESNDDNNLAWDMCELLNTWCDSNSDSECKKFFNDIKVFEITLGEFVKAILKINNIGNELEKIAIIQNNLNLLEKIKKLKILTLKSVVTNQSLYI